MRQTMKANNIAIEDEIYELRNSVTYSFKFLDFKYLPFQTFNPIALRTAKTLWPIALRTAKTPWSAWSFGCSECERIIQMLCIKFHA